MFLMLDCCLNRIKPVLTFSRKGAGLSPALCRLQREWASAARVPKELGERASPVVSVKGSAEKRGKIQ